MALSSETIERLAAHLDDAASERREVAKITDEHPEMDWDDAYAVQDGIAARAASRGDRVAGWKMGLTSQAKMRQMGVDEPVRGFLLASGAIADGGVLETDRLIHPRVEAEIAFVMRDALGDPDCGMEDVLAATDFVLPALEVIDSRYKDFRFDLKSVIADNTSAARFLTGGAARRVDAVDLRNQGVVLYRNGEVAATASGAAVLGNPALSVAMLVRMLAARGMVLPAGAFVMTGGATEAIPVGPGDTVVVRYQDLGGLTMHVR